MSIYDKLSEAIYILRTQKQQNTSDGRNKHKLNLETLFSSTIRSSLRPQCCETYGIYLQLIAASITDIDVTTSSFMQIQTGCVPACCEHVRLTPLEQLQHNNGRCVDETTSDFTFGLWHLLSQFAEWKFGLSTYFSQKVISLSKSLCPKVWSKYILPLQM